MATVTIRPHILDQYGKPIASRREPVDALSEHMGRRSMRAGYDSAQTTAENSNHWAWADNLSADNANSVGVRKTLRSRARYEIANNCYMRGMVSTLANHEVGAGPQLQLRTRSKPFNLMVQRAWEQWARAVGLADKLRVMTKARIGDGEAFALLVTNPRLGNPVKLDLVPIEADQVQTPNPPYGDPKRIDGIWLEI